MQAGYEEFRILYNRTDIDEVIKSTDASEEEKQKLSLVVLARQYAIDQGLSAGAAFTCYAQVNKSELAWLLMASKRTAFESKTWWYPIVGSVPYKGFFSKESADSAAASLEKSEYETWVRPTDAFSTLGWFDDPLLSTTLRRSPEKLSEIVFHEITHTHIWIPNQVAFNESLANFVGFTMNAQFYKYLQENCGERLNCPYSASQILALSEGSARAIYFEYEFAEILSNLKQELQALYESELLESQKLLQREAIFERVMLPVRQKYPRMTSFQKLNNAEIMQSLIYFTQLKKFQALFERSHSSWPAFFEGIKKTQNDFENSEDQDIFKYLEPA